VARRVAEVEDVMGDPLRRRDPGSVDVGACSRDGDGEGVEQARAIDSANVATRVEGRRMVVERRLVRRPAVAN
jgi:hypothetical protein